MRPIAQNRFLDALLKLMLFSAAFHMALLALFAVLRNDFSLLNLFRILNLELVFPNSTTGDLSNLLSLTISVALYLLVYFFLTSRKERNANSA